MYFDFNVPENSLDAVTLKQDFITKGTVAATDDIGSAGTSGTAGSIEFSYIKGETAQEDRILAYVKQPTGTGDSLKLITIGDVIANLDSLVFDGRLGYDLVSWKGTDNNDYTAADKDVANAVSKNMTYTANWELSSVNAQVKNTDVTNENTATLEELYSKVTYGYEEFKVNVTIDGETKRVCQSISGNRRC